VAAGGAAREQRLLAEFDTYDAHCDVVSALEWLFTDPSVKDLPGTVVHFERFPRVHRPDGSFVTPDFTVLFNDRSGIVGEVASIGLHDNSVDKLCRQIRKYADLEVLPGPGRTPQEVDHLDVMQIVPARVGNTAVQRIIVERMNDPAHEYAPPKSPVIVQYSRDQGTYTLQRNQSPNNGALFTSKRTPNIAAYLDSDLSIPPDKFVPVKTRRAFINDPVPALYLATHLLIRTWPTMYGAGAGEVEIEVEATVATLREEYGTGRMQEVRAALHLLGSVGLAAEGDKGNWVVTRRLLGRSGERDVHKIIAQRSARPARPLIKPRKSQPQPEPDDTLF